MKKFKVLETKQGVIVKINTEALTFERIFSRLEKQIGKLHLLGHRGDDAIFCNQWHAKNSAAGTLAGWGPGFPVPAARAAQSAAAKKLASLAEKIGMSKSCLPPNWVSRVVEKFNVPKSALRYAFSPNSYLATPTNFPKNWN
jgi:hypothetical protein